MSHSGNEGTKRRHLDVRRKLNYRAIEGPVGEVGEVGGREGFKGNGSSFSVLFSARMC